MFIYLRTTHTINIMTGAEIVVKKFNLNDNISMLRNIVTIDNAIINQLVIMSVVKSKEKEWENRLKDLFEKIEYWSKNKPSKTITVEQLFYDELDDE